MIKTLKWIYELGKKHERRRLELFLAEHKSNRPPEPKEDSEKWERKNYEMDEARWFAQNELLEELFRPVYREQIVRRPIDEEDTPNE